MLKKAVLCASLILSASAFAETQFTSENLTDIEGSNAKVFSLEALKFDPGFLDQKYPVLANINANLEASCSMEVSSNLSDRTQTVAIEYVTVYNFLTIHPGKKSTGSSHILTANFGAIKINDARIDNLGRTVTTTVDITPTLALELSALPRRVNLNQFATEIALDAVQLGSDRSSVKQTIYDPNAWVFKTYTARPGSFASSERIGSKESKDVFGNILLVPSEKLLAKVIGSNDLELEGSLHLYDRDNFSERDLGLKMTFKLTCSNFHNMMVKNRNESLKRLELAN